MTSRGFWHAGTLLGAPIRIHWTVLALAGVVLLGAVRDPLTSVVALASYFTVALSHELGHAVLARRLGLRVHELRLYPVLGLCLYEDPGDVQARAVVAWGGALGQMPLLVPAVGWVAANGYTSVNAINAALAILGFYSAGVLVLNLIPLQPFDGANAWRIRFRSRPPRSKQRSPRKRPGDIRLVK